MDNRLRRNEICIIGLPRCDFVFASTRSCFIAYGFHTSKLEMGILRHLLEKRGIEALEAGERRAPGKFAFCTKICSKVITSQFCIILVNNDVQDGVEVPNANVNMEYGLMLGFNKYVIPFQRAEQKLPFNVAGLDTIKYANETFEALATDAIDDAIKATTPAGGPAVDINQRIQAFVLVRGTSLARIESDGDKAIYDLGLPLGFNLLISFTGTDYTFLGNFTALRPEAVVWRWQILCRTLDERRSSWDTRVAMGLATKQQASLFEHVFTRFKIWIIVTGDGDRDEVVNRLKGQPAKYATQVFSLADIERELTALPGALV